MSLDVLLLAPAVLAVVLGWSAVATLRLGRDGRQQAVADLGVPDWLRRAWLAEVHPWVELGLAVALAVAQPRTVVVPAALTVVLMAGYLALVTRAVRSPEPASCACFGGQGAEITGRTVARNLVLLGVAAVALGDTVAGHGLADRLGALGADGWSWLAGAAVVAVVTALILPRTVTDSENLPDWGDDSEVERRPVDPGLVLYDEHAVPHRLGELTATRALLLVFGSPGCAACSATYREMAHYAGILQGIDVRYVVAQDPVALAHPSDDFPVWSDPGMAVSKGVGAPESSPCSVLVGADGLTAGEAVGTAQVRAHVGALAIQLAPL